METVGSELEGHAQLETINEESTAEAAQVKRLEAQLAVEQANYRFVFKKKELFRQGGKKLKQELEDLQAQYNELEDSRDTWKETVEAMEQQADVKAVRALREKIESDNTDHERRIGIWLDTREATGPLSNIALGPPDEVNAVLAWHIAGEFRSRLSKTAFLMAFSSRSIKTFQQLIRWEGNVVRGEQDEVV